jgi:ubiquinone/menaquinone biosynthesis C-methylase UbiE
MSIFERLLLVGYTLKSDIVSIPLRLFGGEVRREITRAAVPEPQVIVDLLTGTGSMVLLYAGRFPDARIVTVDLDPRILRFASRRVESSTGKRIETMVADAREIKMPAGSADLVNISYGLHELKRMDRSMVLGEACRLLEPEGQLLVADYREVEGIGRRLLLRLYFYFSEPCWVCELFYGGLVRQVADAGFEIVKVRRDLPLTQLIEARKSAEPVCAGAKHLRLV